MPRPDVSEERKTQILDAAAIVFSQQGLSNTRMDDIVKQSGLSKGALYWYFKSKEEIILALMHRFFAQDLEDLSQFLEANESVREALLQYIESLVSGYMEMQSLVPLIYDYYSSAIRDAEKRTFFKAYFQQYQSRMRDVVQHGIDVGEFKQTNVDTFALTLTAVIEGLFMLNTMEVEIPDLNQQFINSVSLLLDSIEIR